MQQNPAAIASPELELSEINYLSGGKITLKKVRIKPNQQTSVRVGTTITGVLASNIMSGQSVLFQPKNKLDDRNDEIFSLSGKSRSHPATKSVVKTYREEGQNYVETVSSIYLVVSYVRKQNVTCY